MVKLRRNNRVRHDKHKPEVVTGSFELHYEDVVHHNKFVIIAFFASALVLLAVFIPSAVYHSIAEQDTVSVEAEDGIVINPELVEMVSGDMNASDDGYIEFRLIPKP